MDSCAPRSGGSRLLAPLSKHRTATQTGRRQKDDSAGPERVSDPAASPAGAGYSATISPEPPNSFGKSFSFGKPSFMRSTVSA